MNITKRKRPTFDLWEVLIITLVSSLFTSFATGYITFRNEQAANCKELTENPHLEEFLTSYNSILNNYYEDLDEDGLVNAAIDGMMSFLGDPYSSYLDEDGTDRLLNSLDGYFVGIGITLPTVEEGIEESPIIAYIFDDSPAQRAGMKPGDFIISINEIEVHDKSTAEIVELIGAADTGRIHIVVERDGRRLEFNLTKARVPLPTVYNTIFERNYQKIGYLRVETFSETVGSQFERRLAELEEENIRSLVIDLRNNTGGYLKGSVDIASHFLKPGSTVYQLRNRDDVTVERVTSDEYKDYKIYILVNNNTASAAEVVTAAIKESYHGEVQIIGERTYGKGLVQTTSSLSTGSMIRYTNSEWLTPNGNSINEIGIIPDIEILFNSEFGTDPEPENDNQLQAALSRISQS